MRLLAGLGNPGQEYARTRHNIGFVCLDKVAKELGVGNWRVFKGGQLAEQTIKKEKLLLFKPTQFMNSSGVPLEKVIDFYKLQPENVAIVADDVYVACGSVRMRKSGGDGGHKGWKSVIEHLDPDTFWRIRIGVGLFTQNPEKPQDLGHLEDFVLKPFPAHDRKKVEQLIDKLVPYLIKWLATGQMEHATIHL